MIRVLRVAVPFVGDADAAGEADPAVDDQQLAVRAVVELGSVYQFGGWYFSISTPASRIARAVPVHLAAADPVEEHVDLDAASRALGKRVGELLADLPDQ